MIQWCSKLKVTSRVLLVIFCVDTTYAIEPIPSFYQDPGLSPNRDYVNQQMNEHIDPFTGKLQLHYVDLFLPGNGGLDIKVQRSYNSQDELLKEPTITGVGWTMHFGRVLRRAVIDICATNTKVGNAPVLELPDGSRQILYLSLDQTYLITTNRFKAVCNIAEGGLTVFSPDGVRYEMTTKGQPTPPGSPATQQNSYYTTRMIDRNGNTLNFSYITVGAVTAIRQITSSDGRIVNFGYQNNALASISDGTRTWTYLYDTSIPIFPFLTQVTRPDNLSWKYAYNMMTGNAAGVWSLKQLTYPTGGTYDYLYGFAQFNNSLPRTTVVTRKTGAGGQWTYSYNPATKSASSVGGALQFTEDAMMDRTFVTAPDGVHSYFHIGANSVGAGAIYGIGLLLYKSIGNGYQNEGHFWQAQIISNTSNSRPGTPLMEDSFTAATLRGTDVVVRNGQSYMTTNMNFDVHGNAETVTEQGTITNGVPDTRTTQRTFNVLPNKWILHQPKDETISTIGTITRSFDDNGNLLTENKYGVTTQFTYTSEGDVATKKDARGNTSTYSLYKRGIPQSEVHPESVVLARVVDNFGNITSQTDGEGAATTYTYDGLNRLTAITHPLGNPVSITWGSNSRVVQRGQYRETTTYDEFGRSTRVQVDGGAGGSIVHTNRYDSLNRKVFSSYFNRSAGTLYQYDPLGRLTFTGHVATPNPSGTYSVTGGTRTTNYSFNTIKSTNERGFFHILSYRGYGSPDNLDLMRIDAPDPSASVAITRNGLGQPLTIQQAGLTRASGYDSRFFLIQEVNPETGATVYGRDEIGNMTSRRIGGSPVTTYGYDGRNRLVSINYPAGTPSVTHAYFRDDLQKSIDNGVSRRDYVYSPNKKLTRESLLTDNRTFAVDYAYDANDALASMTYSTGLSISYSPDALGRSTRALPFANAVAFHPNGLLSRLTYANGLVSNFSINERQWPSNVNITKPDSSSLLNLTNIYDRSGNVIGISESVLGQQNRTLGYDPLDRLTSVTLPGVAGGAIAYSGDGNILTQQLGSTSLAYQYDAANRLSAISGSRNMSLTYDVYGNVTSNSRNLFQYDDGSMMRCVDCGTPNEISYVYDGAGTRVSETKGAFKTYFMYGSAGNLMFEVDTNGVKREYGYVGKLNIARTVSP
jgi:YD repeat-containing protein